MAIKWLANPIMRDFSEIFPGKHLELRVEDFDIILIFDSVDQCPE